MGRFRILWRLKAMEWKYSYRFTFLCLSHKTDPFNSSFPACPLLNPCVSSGFLNPVSFFYLVLSSVTYLIFYLSLFLSLCYYLSSSLLPYGLSLWPQIPHLTVFFTSPKFYFHPLTKGWLSLLGFEGNEHSQTPQRFQKYVCTKHV